MSIDLPLIQVAFSDRFKRDVRRLSLKTPNQILLITMYSKSEQSDITANEIREILTLAEAQLPDSENVTD